MKMGTIMWKDGLQCIREAPACGMEFMRAFRTMARVF